MESSVNTDLLRSRVDTFVLGSLSEKDGYGYDILNYIYSKTNGHYEMKQSSIYSVLKRLEKQGFVSSYIGEESNGGKRRYYTLTDKGREFLADEQKEWAYTRTLLDNLVSDTNFDLINDSPPFKASDLRPMTRRVRTDEVENESEDTTTEVENESPSNSEDQTEIATFIQNSTENQDKSDKSTLNQDVSTVLPVQTNESIIASEQSAKATPEINESVPPRTAGKTFAEVNVPLDEKDIPLQTAESSLKAGVQPVGTKSFAEKYEQLKEMQSSSYPAELFSGKRDGKVFDNATAAPSSRKHLSDTIFGFGATAVENSHEELPAAEEDINYKSIFNDIYAEKERKQQISSQIAEEDEDYRHINDLKVKLRNEGFTLKNYSKTESIKAIEKVKYIYINRILRDTSVFSFLFVLLVLLVLYRFKNVFQYQLTPLIIIGSVALALTAVITIFPLLKSDKKLRFNFNFKLVFTYSIILFIGVYALNLIISLLVPGISLTIKDAKLYPPSMLALVLPFSVIVFDILLKSGKYYTGK